MSMDERSRRYFELALSRRLRRLAKTLSTMTADERLHDPEFLELDGENPTAATLVVIYADLLAAETEATS